MMLGENPFTDPRLNEFRQQAIGFKDDIAYYVLQKFYDTKLNEYKVPTDIPLFLPSKMDINTLSSKVKVNPSFNNQDYLEKCKEHFVSVFEECRDTLMNY